MCQKLGFESALDFTSSYLAESYSYTLMETFAASMQIILDNVNCRTEEGVTPDDINDCEYDVVEHNCSHREDIYLTCREYGT